MALAFFKLSGRPRVPGPDEIHGKVWSLAIEKVKELLKQLFRTGEISLNVKEGDPSLLA